MAQSFDSKELRDAFSAFISGVTVVTTCACDGTPVGFTANSFTSVSLNPALLLVCIAKSSRNFENFAAAKFFGVNILAEKQISISKTFAYSTKDHFSKIDWHLGENNVPIINHVAANFCCVMEQTVDAGDHLILLGKVTSFKNSVANGLGYMRGRYVISSFIDSSDNCIACFDSYRTKI